MRNEINSLPDDVYELQKMLISLRQSMTEKDTEIASLEQRYQNMLEQFRLAQHKQYGKSSEVDSGQLPIFDEAESVIELEEIESLNAPQQDNEASEKALRNKPKRKPLPKTLPREIIIHDISEEDKICDCCGATRHKMGEESNETLEFVPATIKVIEHVRPKYSCRHCEKHETRTSIKIAPSPASPIPKSMATASLLSQIITNKYQYSLPLYRQESMFKHHGIELSRSTMSHWMLRSADLLLPLYSRLHEMLLQQNVIQADETPLKVIHEDKSQCYMWLYCTGADALPINPPDNLPVTGNSEQASFNIVLYDYQRSRAGQCARDFLKDFTGDLQVDGYKGYEKTNATLAGCWAHARRKFIEAQKVQVKGKTGKADWAINHIKKLYVIEKTILGKSAQEKQRLREEKAAPLLKQFKAWLDKSSEHTLPKSAIGKAINYSLNQWLKLTRYIENGDLNIDNNRAERAIKPFVIGRKNWLFSNTKKGAQASAMLYSFIETAKANNLVPYEYLVFLLNQLAQKPTSLDHLLPWNAELNTG